MGRRIPYRGGPSEEQIGVTLRGGGGPLTQNTLLTIAFVWALALVVLVLVGYFMMQNRKFQNEFAPLVEVCRGKWVDSASPYKNTPGTHPAVGVTLNSGKFQLDQYFIPREARARSLAETQVVLCLDEVQEVFIESCPYFPVNNPGAQATNAVERYYYKQEARLVEVKTGRLITRQAFTGKSPHYCTETEWFSKDKRTIKLTGTPISTTEVQRWVRSHLIIQ